MEERMRGRRGRQPSPAPATTHGPARGPQHLRGLRGGFAVGTAVFAPKRRRTRALHYALAEITGIQACAGTATVAFLDAEPGVDDEAVPLYTLVPCPRGVLADSGACDGETLCSLAGRVLRVAPEAGVSAEASATSGNWLSCESDPGSDTGDLPGSSEGDLRLLNFTEKAPTVKPTVLEIEEERGVADVGGWHVLSIAYKPPEASEVFYARAFRALRSTVLRRLVRDEGLPAQVQQVILCIFETYSCLNRFEVYMALRGHEVHLIDGVGSSTAWVEAEDSPQTPSAPLWLCLLSEDVEDEYSATSLLKDWLPPERWQPQGKAEGDGAPISISIVQLGEGMPEAKGDGGRGGEGGLADDAIGAGAAAITLRTALGDAACANLIECRLLRDAGSGGPAKERHPHTALGRLWRQTLEGPALELSMPASVWQLALVRLILARGAEETTRQAAQDAGEGLLSHCAAVPPGLLEDIACGNVFSATLFATLAPLPGGRQLLDEIKRRAMRDGRFIGEEAFPVLEAARAALEDALPKPPAGRRALREQRVALILPNACGTTSEAEAHRHVLQRFFYPRHLFTLTSAEPQRPGAAALLDSRSWLEVGGVLLLSHEDPLCRMSALQEEADVVIACGKAAAAFAAEGCGARCVALLSEVELANGPGHPWIPWPGRLGARRASATEQTIAEKAAIAATAARGKGLPSAPPVMAKAAGFLRVLGWPGGVKIKEETDTRIKREGVQTQKRPRDETARWVHLRRLAEELLLWCCRAPAAFIDEPGKEGLPILQFSSFTRA
ncbi:hypothetical protein LSM04_008579 [Trypanosoma melophagium]|uniref:uncharacterized protein n=1 Tax=Trypanosoma melophagium TaxID=715481 RepID=UPI00351A8C6A|nr:hypothetical protein LSM04_008579 [Trypanosoma melophagium]